MITKKVRGIDQEVQDGWAGRIIPFELVQKTLLKQESEALTDLENRLNELPAELEEIIESLTEEEREGEYIVNGNFVRREITKVLKDLKDDPLPESISLREKLTKADDLMQEERKLKSQIRKDSDALHAKTKDTIEQLSDEEVEFLLEKKWISSLLAKLSELPGRKVDELVSKLQHLEKKYSTTLADIDSQIKETEDQLAKMIEDLVGSEEDMKGLNEFRALLLGDQIC